MRITISGAAVAILAVALAACGGSSGGDSTAPVAAPTPSRTPAPVATGITKPEAFRFLNQATMGATPAAADRVIAIGYEAWIDEQLTRPASLALPHVPA